MKKQTIAETRNHGCGSLACGDGTRIDIHMANNSGRGNWSLTERVRRDLGLI